jgi:hypothetical protein
MNRKWFFSPVDNPEPKNPERKTPESVPQRKLPERRIPLAVPDKGDRSIRPLIQPQEPWPEPDRSPKDPGQQV